MKNKIGFLILFTFSFIVLQAMDGEVELDTTQNNILFLKTQELIF